MAIIIPMKTCFYKLKWHLLHALKWKRPFVHKTSLQFCTASWPSSWRWNFPLYSAVNSLSLSLSVPEIFAKIGGKFISAIYWYWYCLSASIIIILYYRPAEILVGPYFSLHLIHNLTQIVAAFCNKIIKAIHIMSFIRLWLVSLQPNKLLSSYVLGCLCLLVCGHEYTLHSSCK